MSKIKVIQIAYMGDDGRTEYLDDKGRVWYDGGRMVQYTEKSEYAHPDNTKSKWVTEWKQVELPDEPVEDNPS